MNHHRAGERSQTPNNDRTLRETISGSPSTELNDDVRDVCVGGTSDRKSANLFRGQ